MKKYILSVISTAVVLSFSIVTFASLKEPEKPSGISSDLVFDNDLNAQLPTLKDHNLRGRLITVESKGGAPEHSHATRPGIVYVISGAIVEVRGGVERTYKKGDSWIENADTLHWFVNNTDEPVVLWVVDIAKQE